MVSKFIIHISSKTLSKIMTNALVLESAILYANIISRIK